MAAVDPVEMTRFLFCFDAFSRADAEAFVASLPAKQRRWLARTHPDGPAREMALRASGVRVGDRPTINPGLIVQDQYRDLVHIGDRVSFGTNVTLIAHASPNDSHLADAPGLRGSAIREAPVRIESDAWLGANVVVLPGVTVGARSVVGAGSVVTHDVAPGTVVAGAPARRVRDVDEASEDPAASPPAP